MPRVVDADEWDLVERGVAQRVRALEAFLADMAGEQAVLGDGIVPRRVVVSSSAHTPAAHGIVPPNGVRVHVSGIDLIRDEQGALPRARGQPAHAVRASATSSRTAAR